MSASLLNLSLSSKNNFSPLYQVLICMTYIWLYFYQFWTDFSRKLVDKRLYWASISGMKLMIPKLQKLNKNIWKIRIEGLKNRYDKVNGVLHNQELSFISQIIGTELISQHNNNLLTSYSTINKTLKLIIQKY